MVRHGRLGGALALLLAVASPAGAEIPAQASPDPLVATDGRQAGQEARGEASKGTSRGTGDAFEPPATGAARMQVAWPPYPTMVQRVIEEARRACLRAGGTGLVAGPGFVRTGDLTGDGRADAVVDFRRARCAGVASPFEGTGGWRLAILVAVPAGGLVRVFLGPVLDYDITGEPSARIVRFRLHGSRCGGVGPDPCLRRRRLDAHPFVFSDR